MHWLISKLDMIVQELRAIPRRLFPIATWAARPDPAMTPWGLFWATDLKALFFASGSRWVSVSGAVGLGDQNTDFTLAASTADQIVYAVTVPAGLPGLNDTFEIAIKATRVSTAATRIKVFLGGTTALDGWLGGTRTDSTSANGYITVVFRIDFKNSVSSLQGDPTGALGTFAVSEAVGSVDFSTADRVIYVVAKKDAAADPFVIKTVKVRLMRGMS